MLIKVKTLSGREVDMNVQADYQVVYIKEKLQEIEGIPVEQQRLIYNGRQMQNDKTLDSLGIQQGSTLHLVLALRGGALAKLDG